MAKFAANNHILETTGISPFLANYGLNPKIDFELDIRVDNHEEGQAQGLAECLSSIHDLIRSEMSFAQDRQQEYADRHRQLAPAYKAGDLVWLNAKYIRTNQPS
jgi:hypothetical protein